VLQQRSRAVSKATAANAVYLIVNMLGPVIGTMSTRNISISLNGSIDVLLQVFGPDRRPVQCLRLGSVCFIAEKLPKLAEANGSLPSHGGSKQVVPHVLEESRSRVAASNHSSNQSQQSLWLSGRNINALCVVAPEGIETSDSHDSRVLTRRRVCGPRITLGSDMHIAIRQSGRCVWLCDDRRESDPTTRL
jgi:hypothetical protein